MQDGENPVSASDDVTFYWEHPIEKLEAGEDELTIQVGEQASLPIVYTPQQPSQALITWTQEGDGEVEVSPRGEQRVRLVLQYQLLCDGRKGRNRYHYRNPGCGCRGTSRP